MRTRLVSSTLERISRTGTSHESTKPRTTELYCPFRVFVFSWQGTAVSGLLAALLLAPAPASGQGTAQRANLPRAADGKPDLGGIWQARNTAASDLLDHAAKLHMPAGRSVVAGNEIPYQPWAAAKQIENFQGRDRKSVV